MYQPSDPPNFDDMSDDAAATEFELTLGDLINNTAGTPEDVAASVDGLLETLNNFLTKASTLDDMVAYVFDSAAGGQVIHYAASNFLAHLAEKFTREVQNMTLSQSIINKLREVSEKCTAVMGQLAAGNADGDSVLAARNSALFFADFAPKVMILPAFKRAVAAMIFGIAEILERLLAKSATVPRADVLENCYCAVQMLKLAGPTIDQIIRADPSISQKLPGTVPKIYQTLRNVLIDRDDLNTRIRAGIIKVLEFRASRWGEVPSPDQPVEVAASSQHLDAAVDQGTWYGPDNVPLSAEEVAFMNAAANEGRGNDSNDEEEEGDLDQGEPYHFVNGAEEGEEYGVDENQEPPPAAAPVWQYHPEEVPDAAMAEFRRRLKPDYKPDAGGDRIRTN